MTLLVSQVNLGGEASPGPAQAVVVRLGTGPARRFFLGPAVAAGARGMLMGPAVRGVGVDLPRDQPGSVRPGLHTRHSRSSESGTVRQFWEAKANVLNAGTESACFAPGIG